MTPKVVSFPGEVLRRRRRSHYTNEASEQLSAYWYNKRFRFHGSLRNISVIESFVLCRLILCGYVHVRRTRTVNRVSHLWAARVKRYSFRNQIAHSEFKWFVRNWILITNWVVKKATERQYRLPRSKARIRWNFLCLSHFSIRTYIWNNAFAFITRMLRRP